MPSREHDTAQVAALSSPMSGEHRPRMAKADLRKAEIQRDWREQVGSAIERARVLSGLSLKEFAGAIGRDERQIAKWIGGIERPQFDAIFAVKELVDDGRLQNFQRRHQRREGLERVGVLRRASGSPDRDRPRAFQRE